METTCERNNQNAEHFVLLLTESQREILRYILAFVPNVDEAQEILQETAVALLRRFDQYDPNQPFLPWACRFAFRHVLKYRERNTRRSRYLSIEVLGQLASERVEQGEILECRRLALAECLKKLSESDQRLIDARYAMRTTMAEVARATGRNVSTLYKSLERVRRRLFECVNRSARLEGFF
jgi:RNA polymerase sigma-70 factor, ECF subfamily